MLKLTYTETGFNLECLAQSLEDWVMGRVIFSLRVGETLSLEPSTASFLLPANLPGLHLLDAAVAREGSGAIAMSICDADYIEISLRGTWITNDAASAEGIFVAAMSDRTEFFILKLWQEAQACAATLP